MAPRYDEAPEVAPHILPEVYYPSAVPEVNHHYGQPTQQVHAPIKQQDPSLHSGGYAPPTATTTTFNHDQGYGAAYSEPERRSKSGTICGCTLLVFVLSAIIALLSAAVIGLAAGTGVEASRANDAEASLAAIKAGGAAATTTVTAPTATSTSDFSALDRNCTSNSKGVTGTTYSSDFFNLATYTVYCYQDTPYAPLQSLFVGNFDDCMDACSSWSHYTPSDFSNATAANQTCAGVSFIPAWTNRTFAVEGTAPGNCYLKPGPQNETALSDPNNGSETHAAIMNEAS
ncbi:hypothetical protein BKA67DRAFT_53122 [Truncatella angustata]|uniref:Uncharacterized protein n=1 Tax=Truncatella angustata TaxID=152316 RepID=A0A9P8UYY6_9PEZI|nr:uncharacterized protein BKA67DRAFT_53122 [Truncatella angustata]KAH6660479.1 hypothetical protein BKA67DRAFT_53122 [Truncatella angustata]